MGFDEEQNKWVSENLKISGPFVAIAQSLLDDVEIIADEHRAAIQKKIDNLKKANNNLNNQEGMIAPDGTVRIEDGVDDNAITSALGLVKADMEEVYDDISSLIHDINPNILNTLKGLLDKFPVEKGQSQFRGGGRGMF